MSLHANAMKLIFIFVEFWINKPESELSKNYVEALLHLHDPEIMALYTYGEQSIFEFQLSTYF